MSTAFRDFDATIGVVAGLRLSRILAPPLEGDRTWCHALETPEFALAHLHYGAGAQAPDLHFGRPTLITRIGGPYERAPMLQAPGRVVEMIAYPAGAVPRIRYEAATHEFIVCLTDAAPRNDLSPRPLHMSAIARAWRLILALRDRDFEACKTLVNGIWDFAATIYGLPIDGLAERARVVLDQDWRPGIRSRDVAAQLGVSEAHLCRTFKAAYGVTIGYYLTKQRLCRAAALLWSSDLAIRDVAKACGFSDQPHMSRAMMEAGGLTPRRFRILAPCAGNPRLAPIRRAGEDALRAASPGGEEGRK